MESSDPLPLPEELNAAWARYETISAAEREALVSRMETAASELPTEDRLRVKHVVLATVIAQAGGDLSGDLRGTEAEKTAGEGASLIWTFLAVMANRWPHRFPRPGDPPASDEVTMQMLRLWSLGETYRTVEAIRRQLVRAALPQARGPWYRRLLPRRG